MIFARQITTPALCGQFVPPVQTADFRGSAGAGTDLFAAAPRGSIQPAAFRDPVSRFSEPATFSTRIPAVAILAGAVMAAGENAALISHLLEPHAARQDLTFAGAGLAGIVTLSALKSMLTGIFLYKRSLPERLMLRAARDGGKTSVGVLSSLLARAQEKPNDFGKWRTRWARNALPAKWAARLLTELALKRNPHAKRAIKMSVDGLARGLAEDAADKHLDATLKNSACASALLELARADHRAAVALSENIHLPVVRRAVLDALETSIKSPGGDTEHLKLAAIDVLAGTFDYADRYESTRAHIRDIEERLLLHGQSGEACARSIWQAAGGEKRNYEDIIERAKKQSPGAALLLFDLAMKGGSSERLSLLLALKESDWVFDFLVRTFRQAGTREYLFFIPVILELADREHATAKKFLLTAGKMQRLA